MRCNCQKFITMQNHQLKGSYASDEEEDCTAGDEEVKPSLDAAIEYSTNSNLRSSKISLNNCPDLLSQDMVHCCYHLTPLLLYQA